MSSRTDKDLTKLANAAFRQAARKVIERAESTGTPVILFEDGKVKAVDPRTLKHLAKRRRSGRRRA